jgi:hypothetical protein
LRDWWRIGKGALTEVPILLVPIGHITDKVPFTSKR